jgi:8-oxo-dGTP diphosphatase
VKERFKLTPAAYVIFKKGDQVLLLKRAKTGYYDGYYSLPAGHFDGGETAKDVAVREVSEEVGLTIRPEDLKLVHVSHRKSPIPVNHERMDIVKRFAQKYGSRS